jgi:TRAP-type mannitol/chloroaromatic compound transport system permease small subunit
MPIYFLTFSSFIDRLNDRFGVLASWLVLIAVLISAGNAIIRYSLSLSSNAWLEIQWYLFTGMVMFGAATTLRLNEHVRVDVFYALYPNRVRLWLDFWGGILFLLPMCLIIGWNSLELFFNSFVQNETSSNAGGLLRWPARIMIPIGFLLLFLQGISEIIKRYAALQGIIKIDPKYERPLQ